MKIALGRINCLSFKLLGRIILFCSIVVVLAYHKNAKEIAVAIALFVFGLLVQKLNSFIIFRHSGFVEKKINEALNLLKLETERGKNKFFIKKIGTTVDICGLGIATLLSFKTSTNSPSETYVINILIKFQARS
jgi:hypothetical protein